MPRTIDRKRPGKSAITDANSAGARFGIRKTGNLVHLSKAEISLSELRENLGVTQEELGRVSGYSIRSIAGWESGQKLSDPARQKLLEIRRLYGALAEIMPAKDVGQWLRRGNPGFEGQSPIQVIERGEMDRIWKMIWQIEAGVAS